MTIRRTVGTLVVLSLAGCTQADPPEASPTPASPPVASTAETPVPSFDVPIDRATPLTPYLPALSAIVIDADTASLEAHRTRFEQVEEFTAGCMVEQGFEYVPLEYVPPEPGAAPLAAGDALRLPRLPAGRADVERFGYGVDPTDPSESLADLAAGQTPNDAIYDALSQSGKAAYDMALVGHVDPDDEPDPEAFSRSCRGQAWERFPDPADGAPLAAVVEQHASLLASLMRVRMWDLNDDERTIELNREWDACMREAGYQLAWPEHGFADPDPFYAFDLAIRTPVGGVAGEPQPDIDHDEVPVDERTLVGSHEERVIALADFDCRAATDYEPRLTDILIDLEERFVAAHDDELAELMAAIEIIDR